MKQRFYYNYDGAIREQLREFVSTDELKQLHRIEPWRHFAVVARHVALGAACLYGLYTIDNPLLWIPIAAIQGTVILGFIILLHEQVHNAIFHKPRPRLMRLLGLLYAFPSSISATQFGIWHMDHHNELGSPEDDPKRAHLSPKRNARWYKLLYCTPVLFLIYAGAAGREAKANYTPEQQRTVTTERICFFSLHLAIIFGMGFGLGFEYLLRMYLMPFFVFFPTAFMINRIGQHYWIDPENPAKWGTLVNGNWLIHFLSLYSNFHLEHHYYPRVPFYHLRRLNRQLQPFFTQIGHANRTYLQILYGWFILNKPAHTNWFAKSETTNR